MKEQKQSLIPSNASNPDITKKKVIAFALEALFSSDPLSLHEGAKNLLENLHADSYQIILLSPNSTEDGLKLINNELELHQLNQIISSTNVIADEKLNRSATILGLVKEHRRSHEYEQADYLIVITNDVAQNIDGYDHAALAQTAAPRGKAVPAEHAYEQLEELLCRPESFHIKDAKRKKDGVPQKTLGGISAGFAIGTTVTAIIGAWIIALILSVVAAAIWSYMTYQWCQKKNEEAPAISFSMGR
jgi:hypothetical protein